MRERFGCSQHLCESGQWWIALSLYPPHFATKKDTNPTLQSQELRPDWGLFFWAHSFSHNVWQQRNSLYKALRRLWAQTEAKPGTALWTGSFALYAWRKHERSQYISLKIGSHYRSLVTSQKYMDVFTWCRSSCACKFDRFRLFWTYFREMLLMTETLSSLTIKKLCRTTNHEWKYSS